MLDLNAVVLQLAPLLRRLIGEDIELVVESDARLDAIRADPGQLEQVIMNLAVNARDAMPDGGRLTLRTATTLLDAGDAAGLGVDPGRYVELDVADTGSGIRPEVLEHIFEPFFTTKGQGKGTGLGLSTAFGIVTMSGGGITAESHPGRGATFRVYLPGVDAVPEPERGPEWDGAAPGTERVLVVEDEEAVRALACRLLERQGYRVLAAANAAAALELVQRDGGPIDLLFTDIVMPGMSGPELATRVRAARPGIGVVYTSGYSEEAAMRLGVRQAEHAYVAKPYSAEVLLRTVRDVLDQRR